MFFSHGDLELSLSLLFSLADFNLKLGWRWAVCATYYCWASFPFSFTSSSISPSPSSSSFLDDVQFKMRCSSYNPASLTLWSAHTWMRCECQLLGNNMFNDRRPLLHFFPCVALGAGKCAVQPFVTHSVSQSVIMRINATVHSFSWMDGRRHANHSPAHPESKWSFERD